MYECYFRGLRSFDLLPNRKQGCSHPGTNNPHYSCADCTSQHPREEAAFLHGDHLFSPLCMNLHSGGELNQPLSRVWHPTAILDSQLDTITLHLSLDQWNREEVQHQKEDTVGWSKGRSWGIRVGHQHFNELCPSLQVNKELELRFPKRSTPSYYAQNTEKFPCPSCVEETHVLGKRKQLKKSKYTEATNRALLSVNT